jgi:hypothetical protein
MLKFISKFFLEIFPSVVATVIGAYIVNHYVIPRANSDAPKAAVYSKVTPASDDDQGAIDITPKPEAASDARSKAAEKAAPEKPVESVKPVPEIKRSSPREKVIVKSVQPAPAETASTIPVAAPEERRDANELARAAIERLRTAAEPARQAETRQAEPRPAEIRQIEMSAHAQEPARVNVVAVPPAAQPHPFVQPLPPPVYVTAPGEGMTTGTTSVRQPPYVASAQPVDVNRLIPPADIPAATSRPLDLQATASQRTSVADDMLSAARSVIHAVVPQ